ncbi:MAG: hypothetical protein ACQESB_03075 [Elusimicrobiota bacterium]
MRKFIICMVLLCVLPFSFLYSGESPLGDLYFYGEMPDAGAIGMGGARIAVSKTAFSAYLNPAGIANLQQNKYAFSSNVSINSKGDIDAIRDRLPLEGRGINYLSISAPEVGVYYRRLSNRKDEMGEEFLDARVSAFGITVALPQDDNMDFGMNVNYITGMAGYYPGGDENPVISAGYGWGLDWGLIYKASPRINLAVTLHNAPAYVYWENWDTDSLPLLFRAGAGLKLSRLVRAEAVYESGNFKDKRIPQGDILRLGLEQYVHESVVLRAGVFGGERDFEDRHALTYTAGIGYMQEKYSLDLAVKRFYADADPSAKTDRYSLSGVIPF